MLNSEELQEVLKISKSTLQRYRKAGLPHIKMSKKNIRYNLEEVMKWLESRKLEVE